MMRLRAPVTDLLRRPGGPRDRQLLRGARVCVIDRQGACAYIRVEADGYCGWIAQDALAADHPVTHRVANISTHLYQRPDLKSPDHATLSLNSLLQITDHAEGFLRCDDGLWLPEQHLAPNNQPARDPVTVAEMLLHVPYLWGGNSAAGLDCSALVQLALQACAMPCPGDSDLQQAALGTALPPGTAAERGDLLFWRGHVAWVSAPGVILHANAHTMSVAYEPLQEAIARIAPKSPVTAHKRL
ncbi:MAG: C40 family peptidase [Rhodobacteraceae bacterium]|nr:C40 family peptidase [Paracoccaceae bacterium]TVR46419.1 MAG: peptidoglycan endopeptidase [Paracoccaceae bacterium]